jgi:hypothetical protein
MTKKHLDDVPLENWNFIRIFLFCPAAATAFWGAEHTFGKGGRLDA